jgi:competence protein ComEC
MKNLNLKEIYQAFWGKHPALFLGLSLLLGNALNFCPKPCLVLCFLALLFTVKSRRSIFASILLFSVAFFATAWRCPKTLLPGEKQVGMATFHTAQVKHASSPFHKSLVYQGTVTKFKTAKGELFYDLPCQIYLPLHGKRPAANTDYKIAGTLCQKGDYAFVLKPSKNGVWEPVASWFNLAEWRFAAKKAVARYLKTHLADAHVHTFLTALTTGEIDERLLTMEFGKVGLQHLLAISGFHFALVALFVGFLLRLTLPDRIGLVLLIAALTCYYLFLGNAPSIQRAYIAITLFAIGKLFCLKISGLNALGAGLIAEMLFSPFSVTQLSFQLTFLCTLAILLFYPLVNSALTSLFPERAYKEVKEMTLLDKHALLFCTPLRQMLALNLAVHLISLPVLLHLFHKFPLLSLGYNLFFPPCVTLSMLLFFIALLVAPLSPFLSHAIHGLNNAWTSKILNLTTNPPAFLDFSLRTQDLSFVWVIAFLAVVFFVSILFYERVQSKEAL